MTTVALRPPSELAHEANRLFHMAETHRENALAYAIRCGEALAAVKEQLEHGQWLPWVQQHFDGSERQAQVCMQMAKAQSTADLTDEYGSIAKALKSLARAYEPEPEPRISTRDTQKALQAATPDDAGQIIVDATVVEDETDPRFVKARTDLERVIELLDEACGLNDESALATRREASRLATVTARNLADAVK